MVGARGPGGDPVSVDGNRATVGKTGELCGWTV
jgi:hypothetical protein